MPFRSRAQQRFAFATDQPWAERWASETPSFEDLPERRRARKAMMRRTGGMKAEVMERIAGELCRAIDGRYVSCSSSEATAESKRALRTKERKIERQQEQAATAVQMAEDLGLEAETLGSFYQFADRDNPKDLSAESVEPLRAMGLVETDDEGKPRITSAGRSFLDAARNGDEARARDALSRGGERTRKKAEADAKRAEREAERERKKAEAEQKPKGGGGGGGGGAKPDKEAEEQAKQQEVRKQNRALLQRFKKDPNSLTINDRRRLERAGLLEQVDGQWQAATKADAPAPPEDRISGSRVNKPGSASGAGAGREIEITESVETGLRNKMESHNEANDEPGKRATMGMLRAVWRRGAGAFSTSHRPGMTRQQWAMARVNAFLYLLRRGKPENAAYVSDYDLLPEDHPKSTRRDGQKAAESFTPPAPVRAAARRALEVREEAAPSNRGMTPVGLARARDLSNGRPVSVETLRRMKAYFDRHEVDKMGRTWDERGKGWQAWYGWGGDAGRSWVNGILRRIDAEDEDGQKQSAQQRAMFAKMGKGGGGGGGGAAGGASGGAAGAAESGAASQQWATGKDGKRHPTEEQKAARVAMLSQKRDALRQKAAGSPEGSAQRKAADRAAAKLDGKIRDTNDRPTLTQVNETVQKRRSERLQAQADRARRAADSGQMTPAQAERARQRADNLEARAKGEPVPHKRTPKPKGDDGLDLNTRVAIANKEYEELDYKYAQVNGELNTVRNSLKRTKNPEKIAELQQRLPELERQSAEAKQRADAANTRRKELNEQQRIEQEAARRLAEPPKPARPANAPAIEDYRPRVPDNHPDARLEQARILRLEADSGYDQNGPIPDEQRSRRRELADRQVILHDVERNPKFRDINPDTLPPIQAASDRQRQYAEDMRRKRITELSRIRQNTINQYNDLSRRESADYLRRVVDSVDSTIAQALQNNDARFWLDFPLQGRITNNIQRAQAAATATKLVDDLDLELFLVELDIQLAALKGQA